MILIINNWCHHKNLEGIKKICEYLKMDYKIGGIDEIENCDIIYSPSNSINIRQFNNWEKKKWIFGPHFSIFPNEKLNIINFKSNNLIYITPSKWCYNLWNNFDININIEIFPFPVNTDKFNGELYRNSNEIVIYFKNRDPKDLNLMIKFLNNRNLNNIIIFDYKNKYDEDYFINVIKRAKFGIIIVGHESQGFAIEEMLSSNLPLLVWNVSSMKDEFNSNYPDYEATSIPYWDNRCGLYFNNINELDIIINKFIKNISNYRPRDYIIENLGIDICSNRFKRLLMNDN